MPTTISKNFANNFCVSMEIGFALATNIIGGSLSPLTTSDNNTVMKCELCEVLLVLLQYGRTIFMGCFTFWSNDAAGMHNKDRLFFSRVARIHTPLISHGRFSRVTHMKFITSYEYTTRAWDFLSVRFCVAVCLKSVGNFFGLIFAVTMKPFFCVNANSGMDAIHTMHQVT